MAWWVGYGVPGPVRELPAHLDPKRRAIKPRSAWLEVAGRVGCLLWAFPVTRPCSHRGLSAPRAPPASLTSGGRRRVGSPGRPEWSASVPLHLRPARSPPSPCTCGGSALPPSRPAPGVRFPRSRAQAGLGLPGAPAETQVGRHRVFHCQVI